MCIVTSSQLLHQRERNQNGYFIHSLYKQCTDAFTQITITLDYYKKGVHFKSIIQNTVLFHKMSKMIFKVFFFQCFLCVTVSGFSCYISPVAVVNESCTVSDNTTLRPCFTLQQLSSQDNWLLNTTQLTLILLPGTHVIDHNTMFSNLKKQSWNKEQAMIKCERLAFVSIANISMTSLEFYHCHIRCHSIQDIVISSCVFTKSKQTYATAFANSNNITINNCTFSSNNGGIYCRRCLSISLFVSNWREEYGAAVCIRERVNMIIRRSQFFNNTAESGGAIQSGIQSSNNLKIYIVECQFHNNSARYSGGAIDCYFCVRMQINETIFENNYSHRFGGAISYNNTDDVSIHGSQLKKNAAHNGGSFHAELRGISRAWKCIINSSVFGGNFASTYGGAILYELVVPENVHGSSTLKLDNNEFTHNEAGISGGACAAYLNCSKSSRCFADVERGLNVTGNLAKYGGALYFQNANLSSATVTFAKNVAEIKGGALFFKRAKLLNNLHVMYVQNSVSSTKGKGGAIYVEDDSSCPVEPCFLKTVTNNGLKFIDNKATYGSVLYGGLLDRCLLRRSGINLPGIDHFKNISSYEQTPLAIASDPVKICLCNNGNQIDCSTREINTTKMRGETIKLTAISVDQDENPGLSIIRAFYVEPLAELDVGEWRNTANRMCTNLSYHIFTVESSATLVLQLLDKCQDSPLSTITVHIQLTPCSRGFELHNNTCACDRRLAQYFEVCNIDTRSVQRKGPTWLRYDQHHLKLSTNCPLDYCQVSSPTIK